MDSEIIDISNLSENIDNISSINLSSSSCGGGLELLMNDKNKDTSKKVELEDINSLENELNNLADDTIQIGKGYDAKSDLFGTKTIHTSFSPSSEKREEKNLGQSTASTTSDNTTWDGFSKFNNIPINPDKPISSQPQMSKEETLREKFKYLRKLEALEAKGVTLTKKYTMESSLLEMQGEYEMIMEEKSKQNSIKFQGNMLMAFINGIEFLNNRFDPFDIKLDGFSDQVSENLTDYDDIFSELHDKYKSKASLAPELKLLFQLGGSAMMIHMTNTLFKSSMPGMDDILRQNPELMKQFQTAAVNSMGQSSPGLSGFMNGIINNAKPIFDDGINFRENYDNTSHRVEMRGPSDISDLLSGLKTKTINIQDTQKNNNNDSTISISDLKDLQGDGNMPKRSKRRTKSDKNSISLDI
jgi:hypothetical protein